MILGIIVIIAVTYPHWIHCLDQLTRQLSARSNRLVTQQHQPITSNQPSVSQTQASTPIARSRTTSHPSFQVPQQQSFNRRPRVLPLSEVVNTNFDSSTSCSDDDDFGI